MTVGRIIRTPDCVAEGAAWLAAQDPRWAQALAATGPWPLRRTEPGFAELLRAITAQQVSVASARAIWARLTEAGMTAPETVAATSEDDLRTLGLSKQKARYARALAAAGIDFPALADLPSEAVVARLVEVPGIGTWTAEIYAMFALGRADVFAPGDLALQEGARLLFGLADRPRDRDLRRMAEDWSPWRAVAARGLWAYYAHVKNREGTT